MPITVLAPSAGTVVAMADVADAVFADGLVGPGVAVDPPQDGPTDAVAPVSGTVAALHPHAFVVQIDSERAVLVHLGLNTVELGGRGFTVHVAVGDRVQAGDRMLTWDPGAVAAGGHSPVCPVVAMQAAPGATRSLLVPGETVGAGDPLLTWD